MKNNSCMIKGGTNMNRQDFYDGKLFDAYRYMGAHKDGDKIRFVTYAPRASRISIIGETICNDPQVCRIVDLSLIHI